MGWKFKIVVIFVVVIFLGCCAWMGYVVYARHQANDYIVDVAASFNAASLVNGDETYTDPDRAVICTYEGRQYVIIPENYKAIISLLRKECVAPVFRRVGKDAPLVISICNSAELRIEPDADSVDGALISYTADSGRRYTMHVRGGNIWLQILEYTTTGHSERKNLPL